MEKINFTSMNTRFQSELDQLKLKERLDIEHQVLAWGDAWANLLKIALYNQGPDISEAGSTWIGSLMEMNALMPVSGKIFTLQELKELFYPAAYQGVIGRDSKALFGVPWLTDTRVIYYRKRLLAKAGIDEKKAFVNSKALTETLGKLQQAGHKTPLAMTTSSINTIYMAASWIWSAGGDFRDDKGALILTSPEAQAGLLEYFSLHKFLASQNRGGEIVDSDTLFQRGDTPVLISGPWLYIRSTETGNEKDFVDLGVAKVPGVPFIGGTNLVIWAHTLQGETILRKFIRHMTSIEVQSELIQKTALLPARVDVLGTEPYVNNPFYKVFAESLSTGRAFPISYRSAAVEQRLMGLFVSLWADLAENPDLPLKEELYHRTNVVIDRLNSTILTRVK